MKRQVRLKLLIGAVSFFAFIGCDSGGFVPKNEEEKAMLQWAKTETEASDVEFLSIEQARKEFGLPEDCPHRDQIIFRGVKGDEGINGVFAKTKNGGIKVFYVQCKKAANGYECNGNIQNPARNAEYKKFC
ncbi:hypothetical protein [Helicobacter sp. UBA3407]|uniref:hypothetical protein n=1 Tax=Helicobacter TaxID=209 RepID=UPI002631331F|nr:hypothetical protein [Helicobacter sp. UBA3407]